MEDFDVLPDGSSVTVELATGPSVADRGAGAALYVVSEDVDAVHRRVVDAGGEVLEPPHETRFGPGAEAYVCTVRDPEGNLWTFGTY
ncbi:VOC family protein [Streptomyces sp. NPDC088400]|uniref:VOC family protein n=1 Tax=Streptomyces sp. NPDC088400 TaxID=3365861 RepID=UPI00380F86D5